MSQLLINVILAIIAFAFFVQLFINRHAFKKELGVSEKKMKNEMAKRKRMESELRGSGGGKDVEALVEEIDVIRKEKDKELQKRMEAENEVERALQKTDDIQKRIEDWRVIQESNLKDAMDNMQKIANDMCKTLIEDHHQETAQIREKLDDSIVNIDEYLGEIRQHVEFLTADRKKQHSTENIMQSNFNNLNIELPKNLEYLLKKAGFEPENDSFSYDNLPAEVKKSVLCQNFLALDKENAIIIDAKSERFFKELLKNLANKKADALQIFEQRIERYLAYLTNPKYCQNIVKYFSKKGVVSPDVQYSVIMLIKNDKELANFAQIADKFNPILEENGINLHSLFTLHDLLFKE
jgi:hypothetical protein